MKKNNKNNHNTPLKVWIKRFWLFFGGCLAFFILIFLLASWGLLGKLPTFEELENPETNLATEIITSDGQTLGKFYRENRTPVNYEDIPQHLIDALVATEDERFYNHSGIDAKGTIRAAVFLGKRWCQYNYTAVGQTAFYRWF